MTHETHIGVFDRFRWRSAEIEEPYIIGILEDKTVVQGPAEGGDLVPGISYEFYGQWKEHETHGRSFKFTLFTVKVPHSRHGVIMYLQKYATGVGQVVAARLWDEFGEDAVKKLRTEPDVVAATPSISRWFSRERARMAAAELSRISDLEDTKIGLTNLFAGRGFPTVLVEECVDKWKVQAPNRITHDPFTLLVTGLSGCGFARCDKLYTDLGLPQDRLKRQVICLWHVLHADRSGNTWVRADIAVERLGQLVSGAKLQKKKAVKMGLRSGWIAKRRDGEGVLWLAEGERARDEAFVAERLKQLSAWERADNAEVRALIASSNMELACA
jgi:hypothetical protein